MAEEDGVLRQKKIWAEVQVFIDELEQQGIPIPVHSLEAFENQRWSLIQKIVTEAKKKNPNFQFQSLSDIDAFRLVRMLIYTGGSKGYIYSITKEGVQALKLLLRLAKVDESVKSVFESKEFEQDYPENLQRLRLHDFINSGDRSRSILAFRFIAFLRKEFQDRFADFKEYVLDQTARIKLVEFINSGEDETQIMDTKDNNHSVNGLEFELFPPPTAPPLDNENNLKSLELQEIQDIKENLLTGIDNLFKIIECCKEKNLKEESSCEGWKKTLEIQKKQVNDLILAILFIGSMKSGKSTLLSAISGLDVFPVDALPMTTIPTLLKYEAEEMKPKLLVPKLETFLEAVQALKEKVQKFGREQLISLAPSIPESIIDSLLGTKPDIQLSEEVTGETAICEELNVLNHLIRLACILDIPSNPLLHLSGIEQFPVIVGNIRALKELDSKCGTVALIDSPGPDEQRMTPLKGLIHFMIDKAPVKVLVLDYSTIFGKHQAEIQSMLKETCPQFEFKKMFILINKIDLVPVGKLKDFRQHLFDMFEGTVPSENIFFVSGKLARYATLAKTFIDREKKVPHVSDGEWVSDLMRTLYGELRWESVLEEGIDFQEFSKDVQTLYNKSNLPKPIEAILQSSYRESAPTIFTNALHHLLDIGVLLQEDINIQEKSQYLQTQEIEKSLKALEDRIGNVKALMQELNQESQHSLDKLSEKLRINFNRTKEEIVNTLVSFMSDLNSKTLLDQLRECYSDYAKAEKWITRLLKNVNNNQMVTFQSAAEAKDAVRQVDYAINQLVHTKISKMLTIQKDEVNKLQIELMEQSQNKIHSVLEDEAKDLNQLLKVRLDFNPKATSRIRMVDVEQMNYLVKKQKQGQLSLENILKFFTGKIRLEQVFVKETQVTEILCADVQNQLFENVGLSVDQYMAVTIQYINLYFSEEIHRIFSRVESRLQEIHHSLKASLSMTRTTAQEKQARTESLQALCKDINAVVIKCHEMLSKMTNEKAVLSYDSIVPMDQDKQHQSKQQGKRTAAETEEDEGPALKKKRDN